MAKLITLQLLVRDDDEQRIEDGVRDMLTQAQSPVDPDDPDATPWLATWSVKGIESVNEAVDEALAIGGDELNGILDKDFVICYAGCKDEESFYSQTFGITSMDLATKFTAASVRDSVFLTESTWDEWRAKTKAYVTPAPYGLTRYTAKVTAPGPTGEAGTEQLKAIEFWATGDDHAREKIERVYGCENIVAVRPV